MWFMYLLGVYFLIALILNLVALGMALANDDEPKIAEIIFTTLLSAFFLAGLIIYFK